MCLGTIVQRRDRASTAASYEPSNGHARIERGGEQRALTLRARSIEGFLRNLVS
jgi:hypothetical protein